MANVSKRYLRKQMLCHLKLHQNHSLFSPSRKPLWKPFQAQHVTCFCFLRNSVGQFIAFPFAKLLQ